MARAVSGMVSGPWGGHYEQHGRRFPQRMTLEFADGLVRGDGVDGLGEFTLEGEYRADPGEGVRVGWVKTYAGAHSVLYLGTIEHGAIRGNWSLPGASDAFELRPLRRAGALDADTDED